MNESGITQLKVKITTIKVANYAEIHPFENADRWFKSKFLTSV
jgi:hypothetical protein